MVERSGYGNFLIDIVEIDGWVLRRFKQVSLLDRGAFFIFSKLRFLNIGVFAGTSKQLFGIDSIEELKNASFARLRRYFV